MSTVPPTVSILLPTFNRLEFLPSTIESVRAQSFSDWELIICDDGSEPPTREYLSGLQSDPRITVLFLEHSGRPGLARNLGLRAARGAFVAFLDSDDLWRPEKLQLQIESLRAKPHCRWGLTRFVLVDRDLAPTRWTLETGGWPALGGWILGEILNTRMVLALSSVIVEAAALRELGGFDESLETCEDYDLWLRLAQFSEIDAVDQPLTLMRRHESHFSSQGARDFIYGRQVLQKLRRRGVPANLQGALRRSEAEMAVGHCAHLVGPGSSPPRSASRGAASARAGGSQRGGWVSPGRVFGSVAACAGRDARLTEAAVPARAPLSAPARSSCNPPAR